LAACAVFSRAELAIDGYSDHAALHSRSVRILPPLIFYLFEIAHDNKMIRRTADIHRELRVLIDARWPKASRLFKSVMNVKLKDAGKRLPVLTNRYIIFASINHACWIIADIAQPAVYDDAGRHRDYVSSAGILWTPAALEMDRLEAGADEFISRYLDDPFVNWSKILSDNSCNGVTWTCHFVYTFADSKVFIYKYVGCLEVKNSWLPQPIREEICSAMEAYALE